MNPTRCTKEDTTWPAPPRNARKGGGKARITEETSWPRRTNRWTRRWAARRDPSWPAGLAIKKGRLKKDVQPYPLEARRAQKDQSPHRDPLGRAGGTESHRLEEGRRKSQDLLPTPLPKP